jgi:arylsulfatase A-like enzyme
VGGSGTALAAWGGPPNIALVIIDDAGVELVGAYSGGLVTEVIGPTPPEHLVTPNIEALATDGVVFRNAWSAPRCRATRAALLTGSFGFHTGAIVHAYADPLFPTLPERLANEAPVPYAERVAIGKWHLSEYDADGVSRPPTTLGFTRYAGSPENGPYTGSPWLTDPPAGPPGGEIGSEYVTTREVDEAIAFVEQPHSGPWLLWLALHAAHSPWNEVETPVLEGSPCNAITNAPRRVRCRQLEILDEALGDLRTALEAADPGLANTTVFLIGDNGSPVPGGTRPEAMPGQVNRGAKSSLYEGGINVPLIVAGAGVAPNDPTTIQEVSALVHAVDVFATVLDLAGIASPDAGIDGTSFAAVLGGAYGRRACVYTDGSATAGGVPAEDPANHDVAVRNGRHKLIRRALFEGAHDYELYDLLLDPGESQPLPASGSTFEALRSQLDRIDRNRTARPCRPRGPPRCGLGPELVPLLFALAMRHGRLRRRIVSEASDESAALARAASGRAPRTRSSGAPR